MMDRVGREHNVGLDFLIGLLKYPILKNHLSRKAETLCGNILRKYRFKVQIVISGGKVGPNGGGFSHRKK